MKKRLFVLALCAALCASALTGCGGNSRNNSQANGEKTVKDTVVFAQGTDVTSLDPHVGKQERAFALHCNMFEQLTKLDENMQPQPSLAESWERISDTEMKFNLRKDVKFHNGDPFTADDVKFSYERIMASSLVKNNIAFLESVEVVDEHTVILKTKYPYVPLLNAISIPPLSIVPKNYMESIGDEAFALAPVGTGPYKFVEWKADESITLEAFDEYYGGAPKTKYLVMKVVPETAQRSIMLETGEIDIAYAVAPNDISRLESTDGVHIASGNSSKVYMLNFNTAYDEPIGNKLVRRAIAYAIDRESLISGVLCGTGSLNQLPVPQSAVGYDSTIEGYSYNPEKAKELLAEAGYPNGFSCSIWIDDDQISNEIATVIQSNLKDVGIDLAIEAMQTSTKQDRLVKKQPFDMNIQFTNCHVGDADFALYSNLSPDSASNYSYYDNPTVSDLIIQERKETDASKRQSIFHEIYSIIIDDEMVMLPLYQDQINIGVSDKVEGFAVNTIGAHKYKDVVIYK